MAETQRSSSSSRNLPASISKHHHPYFSATQVSRLSEKQRGKLSATQEERIRQNATAFIETMSARIGFPRRTTATAQSLYHRFHLFFAKKDYSHHEVALATLFVSTKMHDTLKKPQQLLAVSYAIRYPELAAKSKHPAGEIDLDTMDPQIVEHDRQRLISIERLILEVICFNFTARMPFPYVIKLGKALGASKNLTKLAWRLAADSHRTPLPILFPPHVLALGSLYVAALLEENASSGDLPTDGSTGALETLSSSERTPSQLAAYLGKRGEWEAKYHSQIEDLQEIAHSIFDLIIHFSSSNAASAHSSPHTPTSPSPHASRTTGQHGQSSGSGVPKPAVTTSPDDILKLKIFLRENEYPPRNRHISDTFISFRLC
ncbi:cyclin-like protein [Flagelloscypha sp. PMI_526]|nr:cyclin-like protein [Flagelloscypha sp. PMI_526]